MEHVNFYQDADGDWRWRVTASNSRIVGGSTEGYRKRTMAESNLRSILDYCRTVDIRIATETQERPEDARHPLHFYKDAQEKWRWRVQATNGKIVHASTEGFEHRGDAVKDLEVLVDLVRAWRSL